MKKFAALLIIVLIFLISACNQKPPEVEKSLDEKLNFSYAEYQETLKNIFTKKNYSIILKDSSVQYFDTLKSFYANRNYQPVFIGSFQQKNFIYSLLNIFDKAEEHGLNPEQYHTKLIAEQFLAATADSMVNPNRFFQLANTEILVSDAILKYSNHLRYGVVNPKEIFNTSYSLPVIDSTKKNLLEPLSQSDIIQYLVDVQPKGEKYLKLYSALKQFEKLKLLKWEIIPPLETKIEPGDKHSSISKVYDKLITLEFFDTAKIAIKD